MRLASLLVAFPLSLVGCIDDPDPPPPDGPDQPGEPPPPPPPAVEHIVVETFAPPALIAYRDGSGPWKTPRATSASPTTFVLDVTGPYRVTTVCDDGAGEVEIYQTARTPADSRLVSTACRGAPQERVAVGGTMRPAGRVAMRSSHAFARPSDGRFSLSAPRGIHQLFATSDAAIAIYRNVEVQSTFMPPIMELPFEVDLAADGKPYAEPGFIALNSVPGELVTATTWLDIGTTVAELYHGDPFFAKLAPAASLAGNDSHLVDITARRGAHERSVFARFDVSVDGPLFELPEHVGPVSFAAPEGEFRATWSQLPEHDALDVGLFGDGITHRLELSERHAAATGATAVTFETPNIDGFRAEWRIDLARESFRALHAVRNLGLVYEAASFFDEAATPD